MRQHTLLLNVFNYVVRVVSRSLDPLILSKLSLFEKIVQCCIITKVNDLEESHILDSGIIDQVMKIETSFKKDLENTKYVRSDIKRAAEERNKLKDA